MVTIGQRPDLQDQIDDLNPEVWPEFMLHDDVAERYWGLIFTSFPDFQIAFCDENDRVIATGNSIPVAWDGTLKGLPDSWDEVLEQGFHDQEHKRVSTALSALSAAVAPTHQGQGLSSLIVRGMKSIGAKHGLSALIAPVRPTLKSRYPLTPIQRYVQWKQADGSPFDPWLRVHWRLGAEIIRISPRSMVITGTVAEWEEWTGMRFPESASYIVPGALQPVFIDCEKDKGHYEDPNVWMRHTITHERAAV